jgi:hypothetical protein
MSSPDLSMVGTIINSVKADCEDKPTTLEKLTKLEKLLESLTVRMLRAEQVAAKKVVGGHTIEEWLCSHPNHLT